MGRPTGIAFTSKRDGIECKNIYVSENVYVDGNLTILNNIIFGDVTADTLTLNGTTTVSTDEKIQFRDTGIYLNSSADGVLDIVSDTTLNITSPTTNIAASTLSTIYSPDIRLGYDSGAYMKVAVTDATGVTAITFAGSGATLTATVPACTIVSSTSAYIQSPDIQFGYDAGAYMKVAVTDATGVTAVTFGGSGATYTLTCPEVKFVSSTSITLDGDTTVNAAHTFSTGTGAVGINGDTILATTKTYTSGSGSAIGGTHIIYQDGAGAKSFEVIPGTSISLNETNISLTGLIKLDGTVTLDDDGTIADATNVMTLTQDTITLVGATAINLTGNMTTSGVTSFGTFAAPTTIVKDVPLIMVSGDVVADQTSGVTRTAWFRTKVSLAQTTNSCIGIEAQCRINNAATLGAGQFTGSWNYFEQSGTTALNTGCLASGSSNTVETASTFTIDSGAILAGVVVDSSVNAGITNNGTFDGIYVKKGSGALDFVSGIEFTDCISSEIFKFADDGTVVSVTNGSILNDISATANAGFVKIKIGSDVRYLAAYAAKS